MDVGIFGGSFDPPHVAHSMIAETVHSQFRFDLILWVPAYEPPHKLRNQLTGYHHRLAMVQAAVKDHASFEVSEIEAVIQRPTYTIRMVDALKKQYPGATFHLILGSDSLAQFDTWLQPETLAKTVQLVVYPRGGSCVKDAALPEYLSGNVTSVEAPVMSLSAEYIRTRLLEGRSVRYLLRESVLDYIRTHRLYTRADQITSQGTQNI